MLVLVHGLEVRELLVDVDRVAARLTRAQRRRLQAFLGAHCDVTVFTAVGLALLFFFWFINFILVGFLHFNFVRVTHLLVIRLEHLAPR